MYTFPKHETLQPHVGYNVMDRYLHARHSDVKCDAVRYSYARRSDVICGGCPPLSEDFPSLHVVCGELPTSEEILVPQIRSSLDLVCGELPTSEEFLVPQFRTTAIRPTHHRTTWRS